jgi:hypothetical protein
VVRLEGQDAIEVRVQVAPQPLGQPEDEVETDVREPGRASESHGAPRPFRPMEPPHPAQAGLMEALCAEAESIHALVQPVPGERGDERLRVRFRRELGQPAAVDARSERVEEATDRAGPEQRRRAASQVERAQRQGTVPPLFRRHHVQLTTHGIGPRRDRRVRRHVDGEVAVAAAPGAERSVDVQVRRLRPMRL